MHSRLLSLSLSTSFLSHGFGLDKSQKLSAKIVSLAIDPFAKLPLMIRIRKVYRLDNYLCLHSCTLGTCIEKCKVHYIKKYFENTSKLTWQIQVRYIAPNSVGCLHKL